MVLGELVGPQRLHDLQVLVAARAPPLERCRDRRELLGQPADADAEVDPPAGQRVEVDDLLGGVDGVALGHEADAGAKPDACR